MDGEQTGTMNRADVRGRGNIVIQTGNNAVINVPAPRQDSQASSSDADTVDGAGFFMYEGHSGAANEGGYDQDPSSPSSPSSAPQRRPQNPAPPASSRDSRTNQVLLDECVGKLLEMEISADVSKPVFQELIDSGLRDADFIVDKALERILPENDQEAGRYHDQTRFGREGNPIYNIYNNTAPVQIGHGNVISGAGPGLSQDTPVQTGPHIDDARFGRRHIGGRRQPGASAARLGPNPRQTQPEQDPHLDDSTAAEIASSRRTRRLVERLSPERAASQIKRELLPSDEQYLPPIPDDESSSSDESVASTDTRKEASATEGDSGRYTQQDTSRPTFDDVDGQHSSENNQAGEDESRRRTEDHSGQDAVSRREEEGPTTPVKTLLYVDLPEEKSPPESATAEKQQWAFSQDPIGGSSHAPDVRDGSPKSMDSIHLQSGYNIQSNEASNRPVSELPRSDDNEEDVTVRPLVDLYSERPYPSTMPALMDISIPPLDQQPLAPQPTAPQQQDAVKEEESSASGHRLNQIERNEIRDRQEEPADPSENQPHEVLLSREERPELDTLEADDTSNAETMLKAPLDRVKSNEAAQGASADVEHLSPRVVWQVNKDIGGNQPVYDKERRLCIFTKTAIKEMTGNSNSKQIDVGAFGPVFYSEFPYEGPLKGRPIAVKINKSADQGPREFMQELAMAGSRHPHLLPLIGICEEEGYLALVYPYMKRRDLLTCLRDKENPLSYQQRLVIALDLISALCNYHKPCDGTKKYHRDVKSGNVLLDENCRARLGDPGLMRELPSDKMQLSQTGRSVTFCGTPNYRDPYYVESSKFHETSDLYSAGKVLLELLTGLPANAEDRDGNWLFAKWKFAPLKYFKETSDGRGLCDVADKSPGVNWPELTNDGKSLTQQFARLIIGCLQEDPSNRIEMADLYKGLKELVSNANALPGCGAVTPMLCTLCLVNKPCHIPMACGCVSVCIPCMKSNRTTLYCPNSHTHTTGLGQNTFAVLVGMKGRKTGEQGFGKDAEEMYKVLIDPNICALRPENVRILTNGKGTTENIKKAIADLGQEMIKVPKSQEKCLLYYHSGHGETVNPRTFESYLLCEDRNMSSRKMKKLFEGICPTRSLYILDVCFASSVQLYMYKEGDQPVAANTEQRGGIRQWVTGLLLSFLPAWLTGFLPAWIAPEQGQEENGSVEDVAEDTEKSSDKFLKSCIPQGSLLWASSRSYEPSRVETSLTAQDKISVFTKYILAGLRGGDKSLKEKTQAVGGMPINFLQDFVFDRVKEELGDQQTPSISGQDEKTYWIAYPPEE